MQRAEVIFFMRKDEEEQTLQFLVTRHYCKGIPRILILFRQVLGGCGSMLV